MKTTLENVNSIYNAKIRLKNLLDLLGMDPTDSFSDYPDLFILKLGYIDDKLNDIIG